MPGHLPNVDPSKGCAFALVLLPWHAACNVTARLRRMCDVTRLT